MNHRIIQSGRIRYGMFHVFSFLYESPRGDYSDEGDEVYIRGFSASARWSIRGTPPPLRLGILIFTAKRRKKKKRRERPFALPSKGSCLAWSVLRSALRSSSLPALRCCRWCWWSRAWCPAGLRDSRRRSGPARAASDHTRVSCILLSSAQMPSTTAQQAAGKPIGRGLPNPSPRIWARSQGHTGRTAA